MPLYYAPGIYVEEVPSGANPIQPVGTSTAAFAGQAPMADARVNEAVPIDNWSQFLKTYVQEGAASTALSHAVAGFFLNGGRRCYVVNLGAGGALTGGAKGRAGLDVLETVDEVKIVAAPGMTGAGAYDALLTHCEKLKDRVAILDAPETVPNIDLLTKAAVEKATRRRGGDAEAPGSEETESAGLAPRMSKGGYGAFYFPWITVRDPLSPNDLVNVPPCGHIAGMWARSDATRGVHKAPANETLRGALNISQRVSGADQEALNPKGVNCIRLFSREGVLVWGARTVADGASEWRYLNVRRLFNLIEESIALSTRWVVFEPNDRPLWKAIVRDVRAFLTMLWRDGALMGRSADEAFFVQCDEETNPPESIDQGLVVVRIGVAPVKPAEFVVFRIGQSAAGARVEQEGGANA
ncbi:MAG: phage tail sheath family protein [Bryobacteraceae bacterium]|nr:phage tail sheath family protein [Bryobacteraceae bacterium]